MGTPPRGTLPTGSPVPEQKELFEAKQTFMFSVFNANLLTEMGKDHC